MDSAAPPTSSTASPPIPSVDLETSLPLSAKDRYKKTRKANQLTQKAIDQELDNITAQVDQLIYDASKRIGVDVAELTGQFLAKSAATHEKKPTAWNGLVSKVSSELAYKKAEPKFRGAAFMRYVVQYIHENKLYKDLTESKKEELVAYAQKVRDDRLSAGQTKTVDQRLSQGSAKDEIFAMCERFAHLHSVLGIEFLALAVRGSSTQGLKPVYYTSPKTRQFFESHLKLQMANVITLLEESVINGAAGVAKMVQKTKSQLKTELRELLTDLLRDAAIQPASDGWAPVTEDRYSIKMSYVNFKNIKEAYGVDVFGWPMEGDGSMKDPSNLGGSHALRQWIAKVEGGHIRFGRMTKDEHQAWLKEYKKELANETIKVRSKAQKRPAKEHSSTVEPPRKKTNRTKAATTREEPTPTSSIVTTPASPAGTSAETFVPSPTLSSTTLAPISGLDTQPTVPIPALNSTITTTYSYEEPSLFGQSTMPSTPGTDIFDLSNYDFPSFNFNGTTTSTSSINSSPIYPLVPVIPPQPGGVGAGQHARQDSIMSQTSNGSVRSQQPTTPTASRRRTDPFVNTSPADWFARSQKQPRRRTRAGSSTPSRVNTPGPQDSHAHNQNLGLASTTAPRITPTPTVSLYRSEFADPRM
ncbi:hypothetical protein FRC11_013033 [Ceratobasidium sp. 423]|nr:hypothetical protein FRC11_013033 [Ceratobasidium sp. 423]